MVNNTFGDNILSTIQTNYIIKAVKDEKTLKRQKEPPNSLLPSSPPYAWSGGETANAASLKRAQATSQPIFEPKRLKSSPQGRFLWKDEETDSAGASLGGF
jgi:hypothetical protein